MVGTSSHSGHYESATLHAFARRELSARAYGEIRDHLETCLDCRQRCDFVRAGSALLAHEASVPELDPLQWRRIELGLRRQLETPKVRAPRWAVPRFGWAFGAAGLALLVLVALNLKNPSPSVSTRPESVPELATRSKTVAEPANPSALVLRQRPGSAAVTRSTPISTPPTTAPRTSPATRRVGALGTELVLQSGRAFRLRGTAMAAIDEANPQRPVLRLRPGELQVREIIREKGLSAELGLEAPGFRATAQSSEFALRYWARSVQVEVGQGAIQIEIPEEQAKKVTKGEVAKIALAPRLVPEPAPLDRPVGVSKPSSAQGSVILGAPEEARAEVQVDVIPPQTSRLAALWAEAEQEYYGRGRADVAVLRAKQVLKEARPDQVEYHRSLNLLCEAYISVAEAQGASEYCEKALFYEVVAEKRRSLHRRLGLVYKKRSSISLRRWFSVMPRFWMSKQYWGAPSAHWLWETFLWPNLT